MRPCMIHVVVCGLALCVAFDAQATVIDSFESGPVSLSRSAIGQETMIVTPNSGHCISAERRVFLWYGSGPTGSMSATLVPQQNSDDAIIMSFPDNDPLAHSFVSLTYTGGPWDLTQGGSHDMVSVRATGGGPQAVLQVALWDEIGAYEWRSASFTSEGRYQFPLAWYVADGVDVTAIEEIVVQTSGGSGVVAGIRSVYTSKGTGWTLASEVNTPSTYTYFCSARSGVAAVGWEWALLWPTLPTLAGPELQITEISGENCEGVTFTAYDSGDDGQFGEMGIVVVDWQGPTLGDATFRMQFVTDPNLEYESLLLGDPIVVAEEDAFTIYHETEVNGAPGIPDGVARQELIVAAAPDQQLSFDWVEAIPLGGPAAGYALNFGITGIDIDPANPILEIHAMGYYFDDAGASGIAIASAGDEEAIGLVAHPSVTRAGTRFLLSGEPAGPRTVEIFDVSGRRIRTLEAWNGEAHWDGSDARGVRFPPGVYFGRVTNWPGTTRVTLLP